MQLRFCYSMYYCMRSYPISFYIFRYWFPNVSLSAAILTPPPPACLPLPCLCPSRSAYRIANLLMPPSALFIYLFVCFTKWTVPLRRSPVVDTRLLSNRVGVNVAKDQRPARKIYRSSRRRVLYFPCLYHLQYCRWRHLLPLGADNRRVSATGERRRGTVHLVKHTNSEPASGI